MQSPLTPQRGRIESNPREYTHMGPRLCGELQTMPAEWVKAPRDRRASVEIRTHERGNSDARRTSVDFRAKSAAKSPKNVQISTLDIRPSKIHAHPPPTHLSYLIRL